MSPNNSPSKLAYFWILLLHRLNIYPFLIITAQIVVPQYCQFIVLIPPFQFLLLSLRLEPPSHLKHSLNCSVQLVPSNLLKTMLPNSSSHTLLYTHPLSCSKTLIDSPFQDNTKLHFPDHSQSDLELSTILFSIFHLYNSYFQSNVS